MGKYKIAVYAIAKNESAFVGRFMESCRDVDGVFVADTGSTDDTVEKLRGHGAVVESIEVGWLAWPSSMRSAKWKEKLGKPWRFDTARNRSLAMVPLDYDIVICLDLDEVLVPGWREAVEESWGSGAKRLRYHYTWSWKSPGVPDLVYWADKIHARKGFKWKHPVHEILVPISSTVMVREGPCACRIEHYPDDTKSRAQYLPLLEAAVEECPEDNRNVFYLGREYAYKGRNDEAIMTLQKYLNLKVSNWAPERASAMRFIAKCWGALQSPEKQVMWLRRACAENPGEREAWVDLSMAAYLRKDYEEGYFAAKRALAIRERSPHFITEAFAWGYVPHDLAAVCGYQEGDLRRAREEAKNAYRLAPWDARLAKNVRCMRDASCVEVEREQRELILLWPTVRPQDGNQVLSPWMSLARSKNFRLRVHAAVNTAQQEAEMLGLPVVRQLLSLDVPVTVQVVGVERRGVCYAATQLSRSCVGEPGDIVVLMSDDFAISSENLDEYLMSQFRDFTGCLLVNDGHQTGPCVTFPIMDYECLVSLNKVIYHPAYVHQYSDNELYDVLTAMHKLKNLRDFPVVFEHRHWHNGKRDKDGADDVVAAATAGDYQIYQRRHELSLAEKLKV